MPDELRDQINRILFHVLSNEERTDKIAELIAPVLADAAKWRCLGYETAYIKPENYDEIKAEWARIAKEH
jgi:hypothetical protein